MKPIDALSDDEFAHLAQRASRLPDAPAALVRAAMALWPPQPRVSVGEVLRSAARLVEAALRFDNWALPAAGLGLRDAGGATRHLLYSARGRDVDLRISPAADHFALSGQILGPDEAGAVELAALTHDGATPPLAHRAGIDAWGEFHLDGVRTGSYRLTLRLGRDTIVLPSIEVGLPRA